MSYVKTIEILGKDTLTYREILLLRRRWNKPAKSKDPKEEEAREKDLLREEYNITEENTSKGLEYLYRVCFKPSKLQEALSEYLTKGIQDEWLRKNCPLGYRELDILLQFSHFTFTGFYHDYTLYGEKLEIHNLLPVWRVYDKDGFSFDYYVSSRGLVVCG